MKQLKLLSYNIHKGFDSKRKRYIINPLRTALHEQCADILFLQEIKGQHPPKHASHHPKGSQLEYLADHLWPHHAYGRNAIYDHGDHGNAILSRFPIIKWHNIDISTNPLEQRGLLHAIIDIGDETGSVHLLCSHLNLRERGRKKQLKKITAYIQHAIPKASRVILAGDFNDWRQNATGHLHAGTRLKDAYHTLNGHYARTFPSFYPLLRLDRIYMRGFTPLHVDVLQQAPWRSLSDHLPIHACVGMEAAA